MRYENFANGEFYHVYNRGVDRRITYRCDEDYLRFFESLRVFNTTQDAGAAISFHKRCQQVYPLDDQLVRVHVFSLMPNHFHLLVQQVRDGGISQFLQRFGTSYTKFFNKSEGRTGALFENVFKARHINSDAYLLHITRYIHLNLLSTIGIDWKSDGVTDTRVALDFLVSSPWSSFFYYYNNIDTPVLDLSLLQNLFPSPDDHAMFMFEYEPSPADETSIFSRQVGSEASDK